ncbi:MAG: hypothetical protein V9E94_00350 [Microthrixaceae bacterium]
MSTATADLSIAITVLFTIPIVVVWAFAVLDIVGRRDLTAAGRAVYIAAVAFFVPLAVVYLLSRPTSVVRHRESDRVDPRDDLLNRLEQHPGAPPALGRRQEELLVERVSELRGAQRTGA